jgi:16S rRNA (guanine966-N2)-methyltransferase
VRIIAGIAKGRRLVSPGAATRPMTDRAKEGIFSSLAGAVPDALVLDLFAGSGSLGLEALSRGAASVVFVERDRKALVALRTNVAAVGLGGEVVAADVEDYLERAPGGFDLAFVDPPYALSLPSVERILAGLVPSLAEGGIVVLHRRAAAERSEFGPLLRLDDRRRYGDAEITRLVKETDH